MPEPASALTERGAAPHPLGVKAANRPWVFAAMMATTFMAAIEGTIIATAIPAIVAALGGFHLFSWVFTVYLLAQAVSIPIYGRLADLHGRKRVLFVGIALFLAGSVLCGCAWDMVSLIAFRTLQGLGSGALVPIALTIIGDLYPPAERASVQGYVAGIWGVAAILGPLIGVFLVAHFAWPMVFWMNLPIGLVATLMLALTLRERVERRRHRIDYLGSALMALSCGTLMLTLVEAPALSRGSIAALAGMAFVLLAALLLHERRAAEPMLPLGLWRNPIVVGGSLVNLAIGALLMSVTAFLPTYLQGVMGRSGFIVGFVLAVQSVSWSVGSTCGARLSLKTSYRPTASLGGVALVAGSLVMAALSPARGASWVILGAVLLGLGMGLASNSFIVAIQSVVDWTERGVATSSLIFTRMLGQSLGTAVFGGIVNGAVAGGDRLVDRLIDPATRQELPAAEIASLTQAVAGALHDIYRIDGVLSLVVLAACLTLPAGLSPTRPARRRR